MASAAGAASFEALRAAVQQKAPNAVPRLREFTLSRVSELNALVASMKGHSSANRQELVRVSEAVVAVLSYAPVQTDVIELSEMAEDEAEGGRNDLHEAHSAFCSNIHSNLGLASHIVDTRAHDAVKQCAELADLVEARLDRDQLNLEAYAKFSTVHCRDDQLERNRLRSILADMASEVLKNLHRGLNEASMEGVTVAMEASSGQISQDVTKMHDLLATLMDKTASLHKEVSSSCTDQQSRVQSTKQCICEQHLERLVAVHVKVHDFLQQLIKEMSTENSMRKKLYEDQLADLEGQRLLFVSANDSPTKNPQFAKVMNNICAITSSLDELMKQKMHYEELSEHSASIIVLLDSLPSVLGVNEAGPAKKKSRLAWMWSGSK